MESNLPLARRAKRLQEHLLGCRTAPNKSGDHPEYPAYQCDKARSLDKGYEAFYFLAQSARLTRAWVRVKRLSTNSGSVRLALPEGLPPVT